MIREHLSKLELSLNEVKEILDGGLLKIYQELENSLPYLQINKGEARQTT